MIRIKVKNFNNIDEKWRKCVWCGGTVDDDDATDTTDGSRMHPETSMTKFRGKWYCNTHYWWRWRKELEDEAPLFIPTEDDN